MYMGAVFIQAHQKDAHVKNASFLKLKTVDDKTPALLDICEEKVNRNTKPGLEEAAAKPMDWFTLQSHKTLNKRETQPVKAPTAKQCPTG